MTSKNIPPHLSIWLDILRAACAQMVLIGHMNILQANFLPPMQSTAVVIFFLLSGFLIAHTLTKTANLWEFAIDRFCRIYPAFFASLIFIAGVDYISRSSFPYDYEATYAPTNFITNALFLANAPFTSGIVGFSLFGSGSQLWTLPVEWWLYMLAGIIFFGGGGLKLAGWAMLAICAAFPIKFLITADLTAIWFIGGGCYLLFTRLQPSKRLFLLMFIATTALGVISIARYVYAGAGDPYDFLSNFSLAGAFMLSLWLSGVLAEKKNLQGFSRFMASYSFSLYLIHYSLIMWLQNYHLPYIAMWAICNISAIAFAWAFEWRYRELRAFIKKIWREAKS